jgi:N-acetylglucosamine-6-phosphate deacetylase
MNQLKIINASVITPFRILRSATILVRDGKIRSIEEGSSDTDAKEIIDANGKFVAPGFIDIHVHGGGGHDFMDGDEHAFIAISQSHARFGTTTMMPTTLSCEPDELETTLRQYESACNKTLGAQFAGMHIEGPYFAMNQRGAQDARYIRPPDPDEYENLVRSHRSIRRWSAAPELEGALQFARFMRSEGILPALAHTDATYDEVIKGFEAGFTLATHLYSGMSIVSRRNAYRYAGAVESAFLIDDMFVEVIADGRHLPAPLLKLIYKIKGVDRIALITDAMRGAGMPEGESILGSKKNGLRVIIEDGVAKLPDRSSFAGSVATTDRLVRTMITEAGISLPDAVRMMTHTPAVILNMQDRKGSLVEGKDADIVIFDNNINVSFTIVGGNIIYQKQTGEDEYRTAKAV